MNAIHRMQGLLHANFYNIATTVQGREGLHLYTCTCHNKDKCTCPGTCILYICTSIGVSIIRRLSPVFDIFVDLHKITYTLVKIIFAKYNTS